MQASCFPPLGYLPEQGTGGVATGCTCAPSPCLLRKLGGWWQGLVVLGSCWWWPQAGRQKMGA
jgi:hypothetical protein